ncbi:uncharacterized protein PG998_010154 [Apiospora kogelbergensis]|uniref:uncharacterized protein n=1 Tax=Apiospora kogelbergensis TaxID=1337665 RepID=UPI00312D7BC8
MFKYSGLKSQPVDNDIIPADVEDPPAPKRQQQPSASGAGSGSRQFRTIHDYPTSGRASLPPRPAGQGVSWQARNCPNARFCWPFDWGSWTLDTGGDAPALLRRVCMWITLAARTALAVFSLVFLFVGFHVSSFVVNIILDVLGFFFIAWCLARIGDAVGERRVMGTLVGRWHFDLFLIGSAAVHIVMIATVFVYKSRLGFLTSWYGMWILIFAVAWIAGWAPEGTSYV